MAKRMSLTKKQSMKIIISTLIALLCCTQVTAQQGITRDKLLRMYYKANTAMENGQDSIAEATLKEIIKEVPYYSAPYLKLAQLYDGKRADSLYLQASILMYRKFVDIELNNEKRNEALARLYELEEQIGAPHFAEYSETAEYTPDNSNMIPGSEEEIEQIIEFKGEEIQFTIEIPEESEKQPETNSQAKQDEVIIEQVPMEIEINIPLGEGEGVTDTPSENQEPVAEPEPTAETEEPQPDATTTMPEHMLIPVIPENTYKKAITASTMESSKIIGRWVSGSRMPNGRETWILDITQIDDMLRITLNNNSGVFLAPELEETIKQKAENMFNFRGYKLHNLTYSNHISYAMDEYYGSDISSETMELFAASLEQQTVQGAIKNNRLQYTYKISESYTPDDTNYEKEKNIWQKLSSGLGHLLGARFGALIASTSSDIMTYKRENDKFIKIEGTLTFSMAMANCGMRGRCYETITHVNSEGIKREKQNNIFNCSFYKVPEGYAGSDTYMSSKDAEQIEREKALLKESEKKYRDNPGTLHYLRGIAETYGIGEADSGITPNYINGLKNFVRAAEHGNKDALALVAALYYDLSMNQQYSNSQRRNYQTLAEKWSNKLKDSDKCQYNMIMASYHLIYHKFNKYNEAIRLYKEAIDTYDSNEARLTLADIYLSGSPMQKKEGLLLLEKAIEANYTPAILRMAQYHKENNPEMFISLCEKALTLGDNNANNMLALAYLQGIGVEQDYIKSNELHNTYKAGSKQPWIEIFDSNGLTYHE